MLAIDNDSFRPGSEGPLREAVDALLKGLRAADQITLLTMPYGGIKVPFTTDHRRVRAAISQVVGQRRPDRPGPNWRAAAVKRCRRLSAISKRSPSATSRSPDDGRHGRAGSAKARRGHGPASGHVRAARKPLLARGDRRRGGAPSSMSSSPATRATPGPPSSARRTSGPTIPTPASSTWSA